jgi:flagellar motor switch protein FliM
VTNRDKREGILEQANVLEEQGDVGTPSIEPAGVEVTSPQSADYRFLPRAAEQQWRSALERFSASIAVSLSATLGAGVTATLEAMEQTTRSGFRRTSAPAFLFKMSARPYHGKAMLAISPGLVTIALEKLLGATDVGGTELSRELTAIESSVLDLALQTITRNLREAWSGFAPIDFRVAGEQETDIPSADDDIDEPMIAASFRFDLAGGGGLMGMAVPWLAVVAVQRESCESGSSADAAETAPPKSVFDMLQNLHLRLEARLQGATVMASQLLRLKEGDVLSLGYPVERDVDCLVNGKCKYKARVMTTGSRISLRIDEPVVKSGS